MWGLDYIYALLLPSCLLYIFRLSNPVCFGLSRSNVFRLVHLSNLNKSNNQYNLDSPPVSMSSTSCFKVDGNVLTDPI